MNNVGLIWRTVRHLTARQIVYQLLNRLRRHPRLRLPKTPPTGYFLTVPDADKPVSFRDKTFTFLNQTVTFPHRIDWNYGQAGPSDNGKLWTYNLNYFDFLNQSGLTQQEGLSLIRDFMAKTDLLRDGLEPYPTSLRILNWIQFLSRHLIQDADIDRHLFAQTDRLRRRLEYHLAGNHLLENGFALLFSALYFRHEHWSRMARNLICSELATQILTDGGHDERSPMYHQILLDRLLTVLLALQYDTWHNDTNLVDFLKQKGLQMLGWLNAVTFQNGDIPVVNDAAFGISPTTTQLRAKAKQVLTNQLATREIAPLHNANKLTDSGYRLFCTTTSAPFRYELITDVGPVGPDHQPGHAHADTFSFVLYVDNQPILVDSGTSIYQPGLRRTWERSTAAHNTVEVNGTDSSEVWAGFRVGRRARVTLLDDTPTLLTARHDGYLRFGVRHERTWLPGQTRICLVDRLLNVHNGVQSGLTGVARFYFHPGITLQRIDNGIVAGPVRILFQSVTKLTLHVTSCQIAEGFNRLKSGQCLAVTFRDRLETTIGNPQCDYFT